MAAFPGAEKPIIYLYVVNLINGVNKVVGQIEVWATDVTTAESDAVTIYNNNMRSNSQKSVTAKVIGALKQNGLS